jgi:glycosyltransferase involved in cell wall biosynthesis
MKPHHIALAPDVELRVMVPDRWRDDYGNWRTADEPLADNFHLEVARVRWPYLGPIKRYLHWYPDLGKVLRAFRPEIINIWEEQWGLVSAHACWLRNRLLPEARIICETEQNIEKKLPLPFERFRRYSLRSADFVVARNREAVQVVRNKGYQGPVQVVGNSVDPEVFRPMDRHLCRKQLGLDGFVAGYVGRLVEEKGLMDLLDAATYLPDDVRVAFVGSGPMLDQLKARAAELNLGPRAVFLAGRSLGELPPVMNALDALVLPSRTTPAWKEQFGRVIIEAHACARPVIGSSSGAIPEVVGDGGLIFPERDARQLAAAILALKADPARAQALGEIGRARVLDRYTWDKVGRQMRDIYFEVAGRERRDQASASEPGRLSLA